MRGPGYLPALLEFLKKVALIDLGIVVVVGLLCWVSGRRTGTQYGTALLLVGLLTIGIGALSLFGGPSPSTNPRHRYFESFMPKITDDRTKQNQPDLTRDYGFSIEMAAIGAISMAVGALIKTIFP